jgi:hypothetical protein
VKAAAPIDLRILFERIQGDDPVEQEKGGEVLYALMRKVSGGYLLAKLGPEGDDALQELFVSIRESIRLGGIREPLRLTEYIRGAAWNRVHWALGNIVRERGRLISIEGIRPLAHIQTAEALLESKDRTRILRHGLLALNPQDREILSRFYLRDAEMSVIERRAKIRRIMHLTEKQFSINKSRAMGKLGRSIHFKRDNLISLSRRLRSIDDPLAMAA